MKLLCYGDSNTYGFDPRSFFGGRYPAEVRWTNLLARETGWEVQNAGENGREIPRRPWEIDDLLHRAEGADLVTILLGGNDLLQGPPFAAEDAAARMEACLTPLLARRAPASILLVGPPPMTLGAWTNQAVCLQSRRLAPCYRALAEGLGVAADELLRDASSVRSPALPQLEEVLAGCSEGQCRVILAVARAARAALKEQEESLP